MEYEWIVDDSGWRFLMPRLSRDDVERLELGTFDLADFTFGTANAIWFLYRPASEFSALEKVLWRVENALRLLEWSLILKGHRTLSELVGKVRRAVFNVAWWVSVEIL